MNSFSGITLGLTLIGFVLLVVGLVAIFYKPAKRLKVDCNFKPGTDNKMNSTLVIDLENVGKRQLKLQAPYIRFSHATHSKIYSVKPEFVHCRFPHILKIGEKLNFELDLSHFTSQLQKHEFTPTHVKIQINESAGLDFESHSLDIKV
jgi:hypothetical protein